MAFLASEYILHVKCYVMCGGGDVNFHTDLNVKINITMLTIYIIYVCCGDDVSAVKPESYLLPSPKSFPSTLCSNHFATVNTADSTFTITENFITAQPSATS